MWHDFLGWWFPLKVFEDRSYLSFTQKLFINCCARHEIDTFPTLKWHTVSWGRYALNVNDMVIHADKLGYIKRYDALLRKL